MNSNASHDVLARANVEPSIESSHQVETEWNYALDTKKYFQSISSSSPIQWSEVQDSQDDPIPTVQFADSDVIKDLRPTRLPTLPFLQPHRPKPKRSTEYIEDDQIRNNAIIMGRLRDMRRRVFALENQNQNLAGNDRGSHEDKLLHPPAKSKKSMLGSGASSSCRQFEPLVLHGLETSNPRLIPKHQVMSSDQAILLMKETCVVTSLHVGFDAMHRHTIDILADVGIEFLKQLGRFIRAECDRPMPTYGQVFTEEPVISRSSKSLVCIENASKAQLKVAPKTSGLSKQKSSAAGETSASSSSTPKASGGKNVSKKQQPIPMSSSSSAKSLTKTTGGGASTTTVKKTAATSSAANSTGKFATKTSRERSTSKGNKPVSTQVIPKFHWDIIRAFRRIGCCLVDTEQYLTRMLQYGEQLRVVDRKMLKNSVKAKAQAGSSSALQAQRSNTSLSLYMKEALANASLGEAFRHNTFAFSGQELNLPKPVLYKFKTDEQLAATKAEADAAQLARLGHMQQLIKTEPRASFEDSLPVARKKIKTDPLDDLDPAPMLGIEHLDMALAAANSTSDPTHDPSSVTSSALTDPNIMALDAELDLSNLDDLFDGDTMLGDDMLPL